MFFVVDEAFFVAPTRYRMGCFGIEFRWGNTPEAPTRHGNSEPEESYEKTSGSSLDTQRRQAIAAAIPKPHPIVSKFEIG